MGQHQNYISKAKKYLEDNLLQIEKRSDLSKEEKSSQIINLFSAVCAGVAIQPIPFADIFILTPIQVLMGERLAAVWGVPANKSSASKIVKDIAKVCGMGLIAQQLAISSYKTFLPFLGAITTVPLVYGLTYAIGKVLSTMYERRAKGMSKLTDDQMKELFKSQMKKGKKAYNKGDEIKVN